MSRTDKITVFISLNVRVDSEQAFVSTMHDWIRRFVTFQESLNPKALRTFSGDRAYAAVFTFRTPHESQSFRRSSEYLNFLADIRPHLESNPHLETTCGLESWFPPPSTEFRNAPAKWKMALVTWIGVCVMVSSVTLLLTPAISHWPWFLKFITINAGVVAGLTWLVMPVLSRLLNGWLFPKPSDTV